MVLINGVFRNIGITISISAGLKILHYSSVSCNKTSKLLLRLQINLGGLITDNPKVK